MRIALVSGDGLAVSGLLTVFKNAIEIGRNLGVIDFPIAADLGTSWRPDKDAFFPNGDPDWRHPQWLNVRRDELVSSQEATELGARLLAIRSMVANYDMLAAESRASLAEIIAEESARYHSYFYSWLTLAQPDLVFALNMTLSDAVPATRAFYTASEEYFGSKCRGGIVIWDHDLFGSYAVREGNSRVYPVRPNEFTPIPQENRYTRWIVPSEALAQEGKEYPTTLVPIVMPNVLPLIPSDIAERGIEFARQQDIDMRRPILLNPVRMFRVKGVHIAVDYMSSMRKACKEMDKRMPYLLLFGSTREDRDYSNEIMRLVDDGCLNSDVRFLDGVPLQSHTVNGLWSLDEADLVQLAVQCGGAIVFTPSVNDVESVGLGPALAGTARLPCVVTKYDAFGKTYGESYFHISIDSSRESLDAGARRLLQVLDEVPIPASKTALGLAENENLISVRFGRAPWEELWRAFESEFNSGMVRLP